MSSSSSGGGVGLLGLLGLLFVGLKLGGVINWSWWYVTMPFWGSFAVLIVALTIVGFIALVTLVLALIVEQFNNRKERKWREKNRR